MINWELLKNPLNWLMVWAMVAIAAAAVTALSESANAS